jgi:hypothetical protein
MLRPAGSEQVFSCLPLPPETNAKNNCKTVQLKNSYSIISAAIVMLPVGAKTLNLPYFFSKSLGKAEI